MLHSVTWVAWTAVVTVAVTLTHNPLYLTILLGIVAIQYASSARSHPGAQGWVALLRLALSLALLVIPFNALAAHAGSHILFRLPERWPIVGGKITLEAVLWGTSTAMGLLVLMVLLAAFNLQLSQAQILRLTPAFVYEAGLIVSVALAFIPQMMVSAREIREAQLIRGHRMRRARDMLPLVTALLTTGLERSLQLAESMEARGFGNIRPLPQARDILYKGLSLAALSGILGGAFVITYFPAWQAAGWGGLALSTLILVAVFWAQGRRVTRSRFRRERWGWRDGVAIGTSGIVLALLLGVRIGDAVLLRYYPYTELAPPFAPWLGAALLLLVAPTVLQSSDRGHLP